MIYKQNNRRPSTDACGTPYFTVMRSQVLVAVTMNPSYTWEGEVSHNMYCFIPKRNNTILLCHNIKIICICNTTLTQLVHFQHFYSFKRVHEIYFQLNCPLSRHPYDLCNSQKFLYISPIAILTVLLLRVSKWQTHLFHKHFYKIHTPLACHWTSII